MSSPTSSALEQYKAQRASLIEQDYLLRRDRLPSEVSDLESEADAVIRRIRTEEAESIWSASHESIPHPFPGMEFLTGKSIIVKTRLFKILSKMPKGGLLHAHLDATVNASYLWSLALAQPAIYVSTSSVLVKETLSSTLPSFKAMPKDFQSAERSLSGDSYTPGTWVPLNAARNSFDPALGGSTGFDDWIIGSMMISPAEAYGTHNTVAKIWNKFTNTFLVAQGLTRFMPIFADYVREFLYSSIEDGISYVEPRINFLTKFMTGEDGQQDIDHKKMVRIFDGVVKEVKDKMKAEGREDEFIGAKIIYSTIRFITPEELDWYLDDCLALKKAFPHLIAGFDLVGNENSLYPLTYYLEQLLRFKERVQKEGIDLPFIFHAGETLGDGTEADQNLYDAILLGTKRIGHGFSLVKHPKLMELCRDRQIALEVCPISCVCSRLTSSMPAHPLPIILNNGVPVALSSDDPSVFGNMGLTYDFFQVLVASEVAGLSTLRTLAQDSIQFSSLEGSEKEVALRAWRARWEKFLAYIIESERDN
ncbi:adenosine deaminase-like growth [Pluteus cervinus]|uniref:Adenosine deaminase-like growth n=1 Tax=Pluteus cervinus TaxID=181527 RepID=A0ACD3BF21_9AGAR|nr:adenosine deaminase-like growth [Pluteus cervinus]